MYPSLLVGLALAIGAPGKDPPKKEPQSLVGDWVAEKLVMGGLEVPVGPGQTDLRFTFGADGAATAGPAGRTREAMTYKADPKKDPAEIDLLPAAGKTDPPAVGVYRVDGDTLVLCLEFGDKAKRPNKFESPARSDVFLFTLKRAKKD